jgi:hypothetical protein
MPLDEWLSFEEVTEFVVEQLHCSVGRAEKIVREARAPGEVRTKFLGSFNLRPGALNKGLPDQPTPEELLAFNRDDFFDWLNRYQPKAKEGKIEKRKSKRATAPTLESAMSEFRRSGLPETMDEFEKFGRDKFDITDQDALRNKYRDTYGNPGPGRRRINPRK